MHHQALLFLPPFSPTPPLRSAIHAALGGGAHALAVDCNPTYLAPFKPELLLGDLDSVATRPEGVPVLHLPAQDRSDSEKALMHLESHFKSIKEVHLFAEASPRGDHFLYLLSLFSRPWPFSLSLWSNGQLISCASRARIAAHTQFSVFPSLGQTSVITLEGARWPLKEKELSYSGLLSLSNETLESPATLKASPPVLVCASQRVSRLGDTPIQPF